MKEKKKEGVSAVVVLEIQLKNKKNKKTRSVAPTGAFYHDRAPRTD
jgi:hypothetical protein